VIETTDESAGTPLRVLRIYHSAVVGPWRRRDRELRALGVEVVLVSPRRWNEGGQPVDLDQGGDDFVVAARTFGSHPYAFVYDPRPIWRALRTHRFDVVDVHEEPASLAAAEGWLLARLAGCRAPLCLYSAQNLPKRYPVPFRWIERAVLRRAAGVHTCNDEAGQILRGKGFSGVWRDLGLGVDIDRFAPAPVPDPAPVPGRTDPATGPVDPTSMRVGYVGRLEAHKGVGVLVAAVAAVPGLTLEIVGAGPELGGLQQQVRSAGATDRITFGGFHDQGDLAEVYQRFDVVVVPSLDTAGWVEQFGRVAVEAMASGVVVVASRSGALPEVVGQAGVLVPQGDSGALADALIDLRDDPAGRSDLAALGVRRAADFAWPAVARRQLDFYRRLDASAA
jgi:glycosyltransferase involved in cell wall biosynthesis